MNISNALNVLTTIPTTRTTTTRNGNLELQIFTRNALDKHIQCSLLDVPLYLELRSFSIENKQKRRLLVRYIFGWIILQNCIYLPIMYLCLQYESIIRDDDCNEFLEVLLAIDLISSATFYYFRNFRRTLPYLSLIIVTTLSAALIGIFANFMNSFMILMQPILLIIQLLAVVLFSLQTKIDLTYFIALLIILSILVSVIILDIFVFRTQSGELLIAYLLGSLNAVYVTFDVQLMMTSPLHKYCMTADEHIFGAVNIFADQTKLAWLMFRVFFLDGPILICNTILKALRSKLY